MSSHDEIVRNIAGQIMELANSLVEPLEEIAESVAVMATEVDEASKNSKNEDAKKTLKFLLMVKTEIANARAFLDKTRTYAEPVFRSYPYT